MIMSHRHGITKKQSSRWSERIDGGWRVSKRINGRINLCMVWYMVVCMKTFGKHQQHLLTNILQQLQLEERIRQKKYCITYWIGRYHSPVLKNQDIFWALGSLWICLRVCIEVLIFLIV